MKVVINIVQDPALREERLYFFQFPAPFPAFVSPNSPGSGTPVDANILSELATKKVDFAKEAKSESGATKKIEVQEVEETPKVDGIIGQLETYRSGTVKMRLANGILFDVCVSVTHLMGFAYWSVTGKCSDATLFSPTSCVSRPSREAAERPGRGQQAVLCVTQC